MQSKLTVALHFNSLRNFVIIFLGPNLICSSCKSDSKSSNKASPLID